MIPSEKIAQFSSAPPLNKLNSAATLPPCFWVNALWNHSWRTATLTPGVVIAAPRRTMTMTASVNRIRRRNSGILTEFRNAETIRYFLVFFEALDFERAPAVDFFFAFVLGASAFASPSVSAAGVDSGFLAS